MPGNSPDSYREEIFFQWLPFFHHHKDVFDEQDKSPGLHQPSQERQRAVRLRLEPLLNTRQEVIVVGCTFEHGVCDNHKGDIRLYSR